MTLSRSKFDELTADLVKETEGPLKQALKDSGLEASEVDKILLVGGSTRIPAVQEAVKRIFNKDPFKGINPDECVALGAAIQAGVLTGDVDDLVLLDVTPLSLGIETMGGVSTKIIDRNTTIPTKKSMVFSTAADNQTQVDIRVLQGEREFAKDNKELGQFILGGIAPAPRGIPQIEVTFDIDANGIVNVSAKDLGTNKETSITITSSTNLSDDEIDKAVKDAEQYAEEDKKRKEEVETKNNAESLVYQAEKLIEENGEQMDAADKDSIQAGIDKVKESLNGTDYEQMKTETEALQKSVFEFSQKLYQQAAQAAQNNQNAEGGEGAGNYTTDFTENDDAEDKE